MNNNTLSQLNSDIHPDANLSTNIVSVKTMQNVPGWNHYCQCMHYFSWLDRCRDFPQPSAFSQVKSLCWVKYCKTAWILSFIFPFIWDGSSACETSAQYSTLWHHLLDDLIEESLNCCRFWAVQHGHPVCGRAGLCIGWNLVASVRSVWLLTATYHRQPLPVCTAELLLLW